MFFAKTVNFFLGSLKTEPAQKLLRVFHVRYLSLPAENC